ncbi:hypothetical protein EKH57_12550 [Halorubrum sp. BOL3-1]|uniref:hypothetical protein n=1 Tax=Halorubrum sp. BOL3-1 TaxID=2497325 RepID=UPI001004DDD1|nr:hypothetical protein [Halorubrum sp. BOL3-1]QAU13475.1 hypothetical protein EKH57_12550 [Halorubrum sp. BOL3-1]
MLTASQSATATDAQWVRLIPPGVSDTDARIANSMGGVLAKAVRTIFNADDANLQAVDILCYRGLAHEEYLLRPCPATADSAGPAFPYLRIPDIEMDDIRPGDVSALVIQFGAWFAGRLIDRIGVEIVTCDPTPLGRTPTLTTRLLTDAETPITVDRTESRSHLATYLDGLIERSVPHVARTIVAPAESGSYHVEQQVGHFTPQARTLQRRDLARHSKWDTGPSLAAQYDTDAITSTWELLTEVGWDLETPPSQSPCSPTLRRQSGGGRAASTLVDLCTQQPEYQRLLGTLGDSQRLADQYDSLAYSPTLEVAAGSLASMLGLVWGYDTPAWETQHNFDRRPPILEPVVRLRAAPGTNETAGHNPRVSVGDQPSTDCWTPASTTVADWPLASTEAGESGPAAPAVTRRAIKRLREYGDSVDMAVATSVATPWATAVRRPLGGDASVLVVDDNGSVPPGELIAAASHGVDTHAITVVTKTQRAAERAAAILREPFVGTIDTETVLYPRTARHWITSGHVAVVPRETPLQWTIDPNGRVQLSTPDTCLASGTVWGDPLRPTAASDDTTTPLRWVAPGSSPAVRTTDGVAQEQFETQAALTDQYRSIPMPAVPARRWWSPRATCLSLGPNGPSVVDPRRRFSRLGESLETALEEFVTTYTCHAETTLTPSTIATACRRLLWPQTTTLVSQRKLKRLVTELSQRTTEATNTESADTVTPTQRGWIYPDTTADRPAAPFADATTTGTPVASLADTLAVAPEYE